MAQGDTQEGMRRRISVSDIHICFFHPGFILILFIMKRSIVRFRRPSSHGLSNPTYGFYILLSIGVGSTIGSPLFIILPGNVATDGNKYLSVRIPTGIGYMRNFLIVRAADALIARVWSLLIPYSKINMSLLFWIITLLHRDTPW